MMSSLVLVASSLLWPWTDMTAIAEIHLAIGELDLHASPALVGGQDSPFYLPPQGFGVLDDDGGAHGDVLDGVSPAVDVLLVVVLFSLPLEFCTQDIDCLVS